ncbi:hypothetical protein MTO96_003069 [Rhipicephalus appendiculatus]
MWYDSLHSVNKTWPEWKVELKRAFPTTAGMQRLHLEMEDRIYKRDRIGIKFSVMEKPLTIGGYGSGRVTPCGEANGNLAVDQATADVAALIVPNESQAIPIIVGQPFTEQPHVTVVRRRNTLRVFEEEKNVDESDDTLQSIKIPDLPRRPVCLWAKESTVVPPNYVGFVKLHVTGSKPNAEVFVDAQLRLPRGARTLHTALLPELGCGK